MPDETPQDQPKAAGKPSKKVLIIVGAIMALEGAAVVGIMMFTGVPSSADAAALVGEEQALREQIVELELVRDNFQNMHGDRIWVWDTEIRLKVREKNREYVTQQLTERQGEIIEGISLIFRRAQPSHLKEPGLETLNRQLTALFHEIFGYHPDGSARIERILIPRCLGYPSDF